MKTTLEHPPASGSERGAEQKPIQVRPPGRSWNSPAGLWYRKTTVIAALSIAAILLHLLLRFGFRTAPGNYQIPLLATLVLGGLPLLYDLLRKLLKREFGSDLLGGISIITSILLGEYLAGSAPVRQVRPAWLAPHRPAHQISLLLSCGCFAHVNRSGNG